VLPPRDLVAARPLLAALTPIASGLVVDLRSNSPRFAARLLQAAKLARSAAGAGADSRRRRRCTAGVRVQLFVRLFLEFDLDLVLPLRLRYL
jgi:hypothetical protein